MYVSALGSVLMLITYYNYLCPKFLSRSCIINIWLLFDHFDETILQKSSRISDIYETTEFWNGTGNILTHREKMSYEMFLCFGYVLREF